MKKAVRQTAFFHILNKQTRDASHLSLALLIRSCTMRTYMLA